MARKDNYIVSAQDQFCPVNIIIIHSTNVEVVALLSKGEIDSKKVRVEFSLEDMDKFEF